VIEGRHIIPVICLRKLQTFGLIIFTVCSLSVEDFEDYLSGLCLVLYILYNALLYILTNEDGI